MTEQTLIDRGIEYPEVKYKDAPAEVKSRGRNHTYSWLASQNRSNRRQTYEQSTLGLAVLTDELTSEIKANQDSVYAIKIEASHLKAAGDLIEDPASIRRLAVHIELLARVADQTAARRNQMAGTVADYADKAAKLASGTADAEVADAAQAAHEDKLAAEYITEGIEDHINDIAGYAKALHARAAKFD